MAVSTARQVARDFAGELLGSPPDVRNRWLLEQRIEQPKRVALVLNAVQELAGTPFGLWADDPVGFVEIALGESLWRSQIRILESVRDHERTVVPSCHAAGKTHIATRVVAWFICCHPYGTAQAVTTATRWRQVRNLLWMSPSGIRWVWDQYRLPGTCLQTEIQIGGRVVAYGFSPADTDETAFSGIHAPHILGVVDEAGGLSPVLGQSLESMMSTGHARLLAIGNPPVDETGSAWMEERTALPSYNVIRLSAFDTPNFTGERTPLCKVHPEAPAHPVSDHLVTPEWVQTQLDEEGEESPYYVARVKAEFPRDYTAKTIPRSWLEEAQGNDAPDDVGRVALGVDVAADGGDRFAIALADGMVLSIPQGWSRRPHAGVTTFELAGWVLEALEVAEGVRRERGIDDPVRVKIDALGLGMGVSDTLIAWGTEGRHDAEIIAVKVSEACTDPAAQARYANQRAEMWWLGRLLSQPDEGTGHVSWTLDVGDGVIRQLNAPTYSRNSRGQITIEKKADMRKRRVSSPDEAEACLLAVYEPRPVTPAEVWTPTGMQLPRPGRR